MCKASCGRTTADTVYLYDTVWKFEGERADGARREDEGFCGHQPHRMEASAESEDMKDATEWKSLVLTASRGEDTSVRSSSGGSGGGDEVAVGHNSAW